MWNSPCRLTLPTEGVDMNIFLRSPRLEPAHVAVVVAISTFLSVSSATAGLDLSWNACNVTPGHASNVDFDCSNSSSRALLYGCFQLPVEMPRFEGFRAVIDIEVASDTLPSFWAFEYPGGCNHTGMDGAVNGPEGACDGVAQ